MSEFWDAILQFKYAPLIFMGVVIVGAAIFYRKATRKMRQFAVHHAYKAQNALTFFFIWRYAFMLTVAVTVIVLFGDTLGALGLSLTFLATLLSWGLREPIMNLAAWLMIVLRKPYRIGDRVILGDQVGDVKDLNIMYTVLEQVGGTVGGEERSGRGVMIPNQYLFYWTVINYTLDDEYILDEAPVRLTFDSDIERAEQIMLRHAREVTAEFIRETQFEPYVRFEMIPSGVIARVRYRTPAVDRQRVLTEIVDRIFKEFAHTEGLRFAYVMGSAAYIQEPDKPPPPPHPSWLEKGYSYLKRDGV
jgi:small-conductance mechanosensitive channel